MKRKLTSEEQIEILEMIKEITGAKAIFVAISDEEYGGPSFNGEMKLIDQAVLMEGIKPDREIVKNYLELALQGFENIEPIKNDLDKGESIPSPYSLL